ADEQDASHPAHRTGIRLVQPADNALQPGRQQRDLVLDVALGLLIGDARHAVTRGRRPMPNISDAILMRAWLADWRAQPDSKAECAMSSCPFYVGLAGIYRNFSGCLLLARRRPVASADPQRARLAVQPALSPYRTNELVRCDRLVDKFRSIERRNFLPGSVRRMARNEQDGDIAIREKQAPGNLDAVEFAVENDIEDRNIRVLLVGKDNGCVS